MSCLCAVLLGTSAGAHATSVTPPSFSELVGEAQVIARGVVTGVESRWVDRPQGRIIKTFVTFSIEKTLKGAPDRVVTLEFLGGTVGEDSLRVAGMPTFTVGEPEILFVAANGLQFCPLVRFGHGRYRLRTDAAEHRQYVARDDETPVESTEDVSLPATEHEPAASAPRHADRALSPELFEARITAELTRQQQRLPRQR